VAFVGIFFFAVPFPIIILAAALIGYVGTRMGSPSFVATGHGKAGQDSGSLLGSDLPDHARPSAGRALRVSGVWLALWLVPVIVIVAVLGPDNIYANIAVFFSKMAVVTFGGAYAVLAYVAQQAVQTYHWVTPAEMLNGLGIAETTPSGR
jgi:chromate transporter